jgi:FkbM family methyltransferase
VKYNNINLEKTGLWNKDTKLRVYDKYNVGYSGLVAEEVPNGDINAISINTILNKYNINQIDILKIDIEGSEKEVFSENIDWLERVKVIIIELHDFRKQGCSSTFFAALEQYLPHYKLEITGECIIIYNLNR